MNEDMSQFLGIFLQEAAEQMELLEQDILKLEHGASQELLQGIFRAAHTLKGSSRAMGLTSMGELTHAMEDVFDQLRHDQLVVTPALIDALFSGLDTIKVMMEEIAATGTTEVDTVQQTARLRNVLGGNAPAAAPAPKPAKPAPATPAPQAALPKSATTPITNSAFPPALAESAAYQDAIANGYEVYGLKVELATDCVMKSVRALMVLQALENVGSILATQPNEDALENEEFGNSFEVLIATRQDDKALKTTATKVTEVSAVEIGRWAAAGKDGATARPNDGGVRVNLTASESNAYQDAIANGYEVYGLKVELATDCVMKSVRALMVLQALEHVGSILATQPNEDALDNEEFGNSFEVVIASRQSEETIKTTAAGITEVRGVTSTRWQSPDASAKTASTDAASASMAPATEASHETPANDERVVDAGPEARGKSSAEVQKIAADKSAADKKGAAQPATVRVDVARLDTLLNLIGELVIDRTRISQLGAQLERQYGLTNVIEHLNETATHVGRITDQLQTEIMKARMLPIDNVFNRFPRMVRDLAQKLGKEINLNIEGRETELDRSVIEVVGDPLIHMLRNSVDHGVEGPEDRATAGKPRSGTVWLRARHQENHIVIEVEDDGKGIDPERMRGNAVKKGLMTKEAAARLTDQEAIHLIFSSGFSTAQVVSDVSGRGVGMDIVKSNLQKLGAQIDIDSHVGKGTKFTIKLPLTLAIIRGLLVKVRGDVYALPLSSVVETLRLESSSVQRIKQQPVVHLRGKTLPLVRISDLFPLNFPAHIAQAQMAEQNAAETEGVEHAIVVTRDNGKPQVDRTQPLYVVVIGAGNRQLGLIVDSLVGEQEVVIKTLGTFIGDIRGISGATILGDGRMALIVDSDGIMTLALDEKGIVHAA
jgi:two-component system chemotaxis sensor kinase CheA